MTMPARDAVVLATAIGYQPEQIAPFLQSLRSSGYRGDVALIVDRRSIASFSALPLFAGVRLLGAGQWLPLRYRWLQQPRVQRLVWHPVQALLWALVQALRRLPLPERLKRRLQITLGLWLYAPTEARFLRYYQYLQSQDYARILLSDVRDVLFQNDPFVALADVKGLAVSLEPRRYTVGNEPWNTERVREIYGEEMLQRIARQPVSCSGVTYGDAGAMCEYLRLMSDEILGLSRRMARRGWLDQALHNVVLWTRWTGPLRLLETLASPVATLGSLAATELRRDRSGRLLNTDGSTISILHQYDRLREIKDALLQNLTGERTPSVRPATAGG
jgi:hypothetical protein